MIHMLDYSFAAKWYNNYIKKENSIYVRKNRTMELNEEEIKHISGGSNGNGSPITVDLSLCDGCGECARNSSYDAISFVDGKSLYWRWFMYKMLCLWSIIPSRCNYIELMI